MAKTSVTRTNNEFEKGLKEWSENGDGHDQSEDS
jgi:hypothetical protein